MSLKNINDLIKAGATAAKAMGSLTKVVVKGSVIAIGVLASFGLAKIFINEWNKPRQRIREVSNTVRQAANNLTKTVQDANIEINKLSMISSDKIDLIDKFGEIDATKMVSEYNALLKSYGDLKAAAYPLLQEWLILIVLAHLANTDNAFYTMNKSRLDLIDNVGASAKETYLSTLIKEIIKTLKAIITELNRQYQISLIAQAKAIAEAELLNLVVVLNTTLTRHPSVDLERDFEATSLTNALSNAYWALIRSATRTISQRHKQKKKWKKKKRTKKKRKKRSKKVPEKIHSISCYVGEYSEWIERITFRFNSIEKKTSDKAGIMVFHLKQGSTIRKVRVKRGTFSVIALWSYQIGQGVGYRYWSQFNKHNIVNKGKVVSWFIKRIDKEQREQGILQELAHNRVKYT